MPCPKGSCSIPAALMVAKLFRLAKPGLAPAVLRTHAFSPEWTVSVVTRLPTLLAFSWLAADYVPRSTSLPIPAPQFASAHLVLCFHYLEKPHPLQTLLISYHPSHSPTSRSVLLLQSGPGRPLLLQFLPPDHPGENRPHSPGGWGSGGGSHRRPAATLAITRKRGRPGPCISHACAILPALALAF